MRRPAVVGGEPPTPPGAARWPPARRQAVWGAWWKRLEASRATGRPVRFGLAAGGSAASSGTAAPHGEAAALPKPWERVHPLRWQGGLPLGLSERSRTAAPVCCRRLRVALAGPGTPHHWCPAHCCADLGLAAALMAAHQLRPELAWLGLPGCVSDTPALQRDRHRLPPRRRRHADAGHALARHLGDLYGIHTSQQSPRAPLRSWRSNHQRGFERREPALPEGRAASDP